MYTKKVLERFQIHMLCGKACPGVAYGRHSLQMSVARGQSSRPRFPFFNKHMKVTDPTRQEPDHFEKLAHQLPLGLLLLFVNGDVN